MKLYIYFIYLLQAHKTITKCPRQCACNVEYMADLPLMKWLTIPINKYGQLNDSMSHNEVFNLVTSHIE